MIQEKQRVCLKKLIEIFITGYERSYWIEAFTSGSISRDEMLEKLDELDNSSDTSC